MCRAARLGAGLLSAVLIAACGSPPSTGRGSPTIPVAKLPPCQSATATGCDRSNLPTRGRGSAVCHGYGPAAITATPIALDDILYVEPMGRMAGAHVTPIDHGAIYIKGAFSTPTRLAAVYAPMDGDIPTVTRAVRGSGSSAFDDYAVTVEATCTFRVRYSNLVRFAGELGNAVGQLPGNSAKDLDLAVKAGDLIGYTGLPTANGIDVWVENDDSTLTGFIDPAEYTAAEAWKTHVVDLFDYTSEPLKSRLLALMERDATPRFGKIDYDVDGRLVGSWFLVGSGGYAGLGTPGDANWVGHLSVVYDSDDPRQIVVSFGSYQGSPRQFAVIGNSPDPAAVGVADGVVKYALGEIVYYSGVTGQVWDHVTYLQHVRARAGSDVIGTVLVQLVGARSVRMEIFPGRQPGAISGFDAGALMYER